jgi:hypothetical protein
MTSHVSNENSNINNIMSYDSSNEECETFTNSKIKCDICLKDFNPADKEHLKQCDNCLTYYHTSCAKEIGDRDLKKKICRKCREDPEMKIPCLACEQTKGSMIKCDAKWVHYMCATTLKKCFTKKSDSQYGVTMDNRHNKIERVCHLCKKKNGYTMKCNNCDLIFHPYCALDNNLDINFVSTKIQTNIYNKFEVILSCDELHKFFIPRNEKLQKEKFEKLESNNRNSFLLREKEKDCHRTHHNHNLNNNNFSGNKPPQENNGPHRNTQNKLQGKLSSNKLSSVTRLRSIRDRLKRLKTEKNLQINSLNYQRLRSTFINKYKGDLTPSYKQEGWNWEYYNNYFLPVQENDLILLENSNLNENASKIEEMEEIIKNLSPVGESRNSTITPSPSTRPFKNVVVCNIRKRIQNKMMEFLAVYDISKVDDMKLHPDYLNYRNELNSITPPDHFKFLSKRRRSPEEENTTFSLELINKKNFKIIEDEEDNISKEKDTYHKKSEHSSSNRIKFSIDDVTDQLGDSVSLQPFSSSFKTLSNEVIEGETNLENVNSDKLTPNLISEASKAKKFLKKVKLLSYFKLKKKHKETLKEEERVIKKIRKTLKSKNIMFRELNDVDQEILIKNEMLKNTVGKNKKILTQALEKMKNKFKETPKQDQILHDKNTLTTYKSVSKYGNIIRRLIKGVEEKTNEEIMKNRGKTKKYYEYMLSKYRTDKEIQEQILQNDSDCCVCFFTNTEDTNPIVFCDSCNVAVHQECYGIPEIPEGDYFCDLCTFKNKNGKTTFNKECILCKNSKGAMKKYDKSGDNWVHVTCVLISQFLSFKNYSTLDSILDTHLNKNSKEKCEICKKEGGELFTFSCESKKIAKAYYHFMCAYLEGYEMQIKTEFKNDDKFYKKLTPIVNYSNLQDVELGIGKVIEKKDNQKRFRQMSYHREDVGCNIKNKIPGNMNTLKNYAKSSILMSTAFNFQCISEDKKKNCEKSLLDNYKSSIESLNHRMEIETPNFYKDKCAVCFEDRISRILNNEFSNCGKCGLFYHNVRNVF